MAEDNATNRKVALAQLRKLGYKASAVTNGAEAVEAVKHGGYDLVLMDCQMPVMDGFEATRSIRESMHPGIPIIAITADAMPADRDRCLSEGMNDYLAKPVELSRLIGSACQVAAGIRRRATRLQARSSPTGSRRRSFSMGRLCCGG